MSTAFAQVERARGLSGPDGDALSAPIAELAGISLDDLASQVALLKRIDKKYLVPSEMAAELVEYLGRNGAQALTIQGKREFVYLSDYYDTPDFGLHRMAASKRRRRFKIRSRIYLDSGLHFMELKTRSGRGHNVKDRLRLEDVPLEICERLRAGEPVEQENLVATPWISDWLATYLAKRDAVPSRRAGARIAAGMTSMVRSVYVRSTLRLPSQSRLTFDQDLVLSTVSGRHIHRVSDVVVETKSHGSPSEADRWLWRRGVRPARLSKYAVGAALDNPDLPANYWHKTLKELKEKATK